MTMNTFPLSTGKLIKFTGQQSLKNLHLAAASIGSDKLGFTPEQLGLHSARSGAAMAMPVFTIMLLGHWLSNVFLVTLVSKPRNSALASSRK
jgi:hypothetical protein